MEEFVELTMNFKSRFAICQVRGVPVAIVIIGIRQTSA
jgi:hypothetical protein